jgi:hypothetical protein
MRNHAIVHEPHSSNVAAQSQLGWAPRRPCEGSAAAPKPTAELQHRDGQPGLPRPRRSAALSTLHTRPASARRASARAPHARPRADVHRPPLVNIGVHGLADSAQARQRSGSQRCVQKPVGRAETRAARPPPTDPARPSVECDIAALVTVRRGDLSHARCSDAATDTASSTEPRFFCAALLQDRCARLALAGSPSVECDTAAVVTVRRGDMSHAANDANHPSPFADRSPMQVNLGGPRERLPLGRSRWWSPTRTRFAFCSTSLLVRASVSRGRPRRRS